MATIRIQRYEHSFVQMDKRPLEDKDMTWQAKGLFAYLMTLPNDWNINVADLTNRSKNGKDSTGAILKELIKLGYVSKRRKHNAKGHFEGYDYTVFENRKDNAEYTPTIKANTVNGKTVNGKTVNGKPATNNKPLTNNTLTNKTTQGVIPLNKEQLRAKQFKQNLEQVEFPSSWSDGLTKWVKRYMQVINEEHTSAYYSPKHLQKTVKQVYNLQEHENRSAQYIADLISLCAKKGWRSIDSSYLEDATEAKVLPKFQRLV